MNRITLTGLVGAFALGAWGAAWIWGPHTGGVVALVGAGLVVLREVL